MKDKEYHILYRSNNVDKVREYHRLHNSMKYNNDIEYRLKLLKYIKQYRLNNVDKIRDKPFQENRGRKQLMGLDDNLELYNLF